MAEFGQRIGRKPQRFEQAIMPDCVASGIALISPQA